MGKCRKVRHIVRLLQMLRRWRQRAATAAAPPDVAAGHVAVCVGSSSRRFVVRASHLNHPAFRELLCLAEEEFGFPSGRAGPLALPCDESLFEHVLHVISYSSSSSSSRFQQCCLEDLEMLAADSPRPPPSGRRARFVKQMRASMLHSAHCGRRS